MGKVTEYLVNLITKQVEDKGIVVWYDPEKVYSGVIDKLSIPVTTILRYEDSFFVLRARIEPFLEFIDENGKPRPECEVPPKLIEARKKPWSFHRKGRSHSGRSRSRFTSFVGSLLNTVQG